ncbi:cation:proton antiporter [Candidatus Bathyarchaeota archaeon]|nr:cation:proton antiporter [Candidatus Bathyarchaeota archaeon]
MEQAHLFRAVIDICLLIIAAELASSLGSRFNLPRILGPLFAGILMGPYLLGGIIIGETPFIEYSELILVFSEIGAVLLLFQAGLHMRFKELLRTGIASFAIAAMGVILPFFLGLLATIWLGYDLLVGMIIGGTLSATSIAISLKCLGEFNQLGSEEAKLIIGAAVIDDVLALSISSVILSIITDPVSIRLSSTIRSITFTLLLWFSLTALTSVLVPWFTEYVDKLEKIDPVKQNLIPLASILLCFGFAGLSGLFGLSPLVGAFIAGMAVADSRFHEDVSEFTEHLGVLFIPLFFIVTGANVNPYAMLSSDFVLVGILGIIAVVSKLYGCGIPAQYFLKDKEKGLRVGYGMISRGEIGLVISNIGKTYGIITDEVYAALILVIFITTLLPPLLLRNSYLNDPSCILPDHIRKEWEKA